MPYTHTTKNSGDLIRSSDWNAIGGELERLEVEKINRNGGDTMFGPLTIEGLGGPVPDFKSSLSNIKITTPELEVTGSLTIGGKIQGDKLAPNLISNSNVNTNTGVVSSGFGVSGNISLEAVHAYTKGFEGLYDNVAGTAITDLNLINNATDTAPFWFGSDSRGPRVSNKSGLGEGKIIKITGDNSGTDAAIFFPFEKDIFAQKVHFKTWVKIISAGVTVGFGLDSGQNKLASGFTVTQADSSGAEHGWYRIDTIIDLQQEVLLQGFNFSMGIESGGYFEVYLALPYLSSVGENKWGPSVSDMSHTQTNWEYEHVIIRGIQGGGYAGATNTNLIHHTVFATEVTARVPGDAIMGAAKHYGAGVSGRKHGYFIGGRNIDGTTSVLTDKFIHATNADQVLAGTPFTINIGTSPYTFSDERAEKCFYGTGTYCNEQIKIDNATDTQEWKRSSGWSGNIHGSGGFHDAIKGWASGYNVNTLGFLFKTETFYNISGSYSTLRGDPADGSSFNDSLNTRKGFGYKLGSNYGPYNYKANKFNFTTETWSNIPDMPYWHSETAWHGGELKGYSVGGIDGVQNKNGAIMDYATDTVVMAPHIDAPIAICSNSINNSAI